MAEFITQNGATFVVGFLAALAVALAALRLIRDRREGKRSCGNHCNGCAMAGSCHIQENK